MMIDRDLESLLDSETEAKELLLSSDVRESMMMAAEEQFSHTAR